MRGRGRCRTRGRADAPTGPWKTAPTRFPTAPTAHYLRPVNLKEDRPDTTTRPSTTSLSLKETDRLPYPAAQRRFAPITMPWNA